MIFAGSSVAHAVPLVGGSNTGGSQLLGGGNTGPGQNTTLVNPLGAGANLFTLLDYVLKLAIRIGSIAIILMIVFIGYKFVAAQGAPGKIEEARKMLFWTVVGALILLGAQAISIGIAATVQAIATGS